MCACVSADDIVFDGEPVCHLNVNATAGTRRRVVIDYVVSDDGYVRPVVEDCPARLCGVPDHFVGLYPRHGVVAEDGPALACRG